jgi:carboxymethylenebutenolidase
MCDDDIHQGVSQDYSVSRRGFGLTALAAAGYVTSAQAQAAAAVTEADVNVKTPDGVADAVLFTPPGKGPFPGVLIWTDIGGLRPVFRDMGRRLASSGYVVLVPNPFYRSQKAPVIDGALNFGDPAVRQRLFAMRAAMSPNDGVTKDALAYVAFLGAQAKVSKKAKIGVQGYCMGGPLTLMTGAASPRIGAGATFHGGTLVAKTDSPHLLAPKLHGRYLVCEAENDDKSDPTAKDQVKAAFAAAKVPLDISVYPAQHGWCVPGSQVYNAAEAERAWTNLLAHYKAGLA